MRSLTSSSWTGLPIHTCQDKERFSAWTLDLREPTLVLWLNSGSVMDVRLNARERWHFKTRAKHFDLYSAATYDGVFANDSPRDALIVTLPRRLISTLLQSLGSDFAFEHCRFQFADPTLDKMVRALADQALKPEPLGPLYTQSLSAAIVGRLAMSNHRTPSNGRSVTPLPNVTQEILQTLIKGHSSGAALRVDQMALVSGMGLGDFLKAFKLTFGMTPHQFLLESRMVRAKSLLAEGKALTAVALELGFASHAHFSATFRARTGHTPSAYRLQSKTPRCRTCKTAATPESVRS